MANNDIIAVIQARTSSTRLRGKVLMDICGLPLLSVAVRRLKHSKKITKIIIATSNQIEDDAVAELAKHEQVEIFRGSLEDVASRFVTIAQNHSPLMLVRICGDSPFIDPELVDAAILEMNKSKCDLVTTSNPRSVPHGVSVEVLNAKSFIEASKHFADISDKEHVTKYFYDHPGEFTIKAFAPSVSVPISTSLAVDTQEDLEKIRKIAAKLGNTLLTANFQDIIKKAREVE